MTLTMDQLAEAIRDTFVPLIIGHNQPCMSGDMRDRLHAHQRRRYKDACDTAARAVLAAIEAQGYAVVPKDPTKEMVDAGSAAIQSNGFVETATELGYAVMLQSAPKIGDDR